MMNNLFFRPFTLSPTTDVHEKKQDKEMDGEEDNDLPTAISL